MPLSDSELNQLDRAIERRGEYIEDTVREVSDAYYEEMRDLRDEVEGALEDVDSDDVDAVAAARRQILQADDIHQAVWERWSERLDGIIDHIDDYYEVNGTAPKIDRAVAETLKGVWPDGAGDMPQGLAGDIYDLSRHHRRGLANAMTRNVLGGLERRQMVNELEELTGRTKSQSAQLVRDSSQAYSRTVNGKKAEAAGFEHYEYEGPADDATRPFCNEHLGKVYTKDEIAALDNGQTGRGTAFVRGGGYNCRHDWQPVEPDWFEDDEWEEMRPDNPPSADTEDE